MSQGRLAPALLIAPAGIAFLALFVAPLAWLLAISLDAPLWTLRHYARLAGDAYYLATYARTLLLGAAVAGVTTVLGAPLAWWLARLPIRRAAPLLALVTVPLWSSAVVRSFAWVVLLGQRGLIGRALAALGLQAPVMLQTLPAVIVALAQVLLPIVVLALYGVVRGIDPALEAAARTLGASRLRAACSVTLPLVLPALASAFALVFVLSVGAFVTPNLVGGPRVHVASVMIYEQMVDLADWPFAAALSVLLLAMVLIALLAQRRLVRPA